MTVTALKGNFPQKVAREINFQPKWWCSGLTLHYDTTVGLSRGRGFDSSLPPRGGSHLGLKTPPLSWDEDRLL